MGSAAQPRSGTAPKAPAASTPPAFTRNLRRLCRFERIRLAPMPLSTTDCRRSLFMSSPPDAMWPQTSVCCDPLAVVGFAIVARAKIVYNIVFNIIIVIGGLVARPARPYQRRYVLRRGVDGGKISQTSEATCAEIPRDRG